MSSGPPPCPPLMIRLLSASVAAATRAGQIIRQVGGSGELGIVNKGYDDPQTEADRKAQCCIVTTLETRFPGIKIVGEETLAPSAEDSELVVREESEEVLREQCPPEHVTVQDKDITVWVDPLDGTSEFVKGNDELVTVMIGITVRGEPVGGVLNQPFYISPPRATGPPPKVGVGRTIWGLTHLGVRGLTLPTAVSPAMKISKGELRIVTYKDSESWEFIDQTIKSFLNPSELLCLGGAEILQVLDGKADAFVYPGSCWEMWDTCALDGIVRAAGGCMTDIHGDQLRYDPVPSEFTGYALVSGVIATLCCDLHHEIIVTVPEHVRKMLPAKLKISC